MEQDDDELSQGAEWLSEKGQWTKRKESASDLTYYFHKKWHLFSWSCPPKELRFVERSENDVLQKPDDGITGRNNVDSEQLLSNNDNYSRLLSNDDIPQLLSNNNNDSQQLSNNNNDSVVSSHHDSDSDYEDTQTENNKQTKKYIEDEENEEHREEDEDDEGHREVKNDKEDDKYVENKRSTKKSGSKKAQSTTKTETNLRHMSGWKVSTTLGLEITAFLPFPSTNKQLYMLIPMILIIHGSRTKKAIQM